MGERKTVLVTGANMGLGLEIIRALCRSKQAYEIIVGGKSLVKAKQAAQDVVREYPSTQSRAWPLQVDIEDDDSINGAFGEVQSKFGWLDALVNNAGAQFDPQINLGKLTWRQGWNQSWNVNVAGSWIMTATFIPLLLKSKDPRLIFITSGTSSLVEADEFSLNMNQIPKPGWPKKDLRPSASITAYRSAKTGMNMMMREWHRFLQADGVKVWCVSPGFLGTNLSGDQRSNDNRGVETLAAAGDFVRTVMEGARDEDVGKIVNKAGVQPWNLSLSNTQGKVTKVLSRYNVYGPTKKA